MSGLSSEVVVLVVVEEVGGSGLRTRVLCMFERKSQMRGSCWNWALASACDWCNVKT